MTAGVFISYRRADSAAYAGRLYDHLDRAFAENTIFMDVDSLEPGVDFVEELRRRVDASKVVLVIIGRQWADIRGTDGQPRLHAPDDFVRMEIEHALAGDCRVVPVLVDDAEMPPPEALPDGLRPLTRRNAVNLRHARFRDDAEALTGFLRKIVEAPGTPEPGAVPVEAPENRPDMDPFELYLLPGNANKFLILEADEGPFVQFTANAENPDQIVLDLPHAALAEDQIGLAGQFFASCAERHGLENLSGGHSFNLVLPRDATLMAEVAYAVFTEVYGYREVPLLGVTIDG